MKTLSVLLACVLFLVAHALSTWLKPTALPLAAASPAADLVPSARDGWTAPDPGTNK